MLDVTAPDRQLLVSIDMERYGPRDNLLQHRAQREFRRVMEYAAAQLGLDRAAWRIQPSGDGELALLSPGAVEIAVVTGLAPTLDRALREHNRGLRPEARIRLRVAIHEGLVHVDSPNGHAGNAVVEVCRLVDAPSLKAALRAFPMANVALILSDRIYQDVVRHYHDLRPDRFRRVLVELRDKGFRQDAWICVPDEDVSRLGETGDAAVGEPADNDDPRSPEPGATTGGGNTFGHIVSHGPAAFGNHNQVLGCRPTSDPGADQWNR